MEIINELEKITSFLVIANNTKCEPYYNYPSIYKAVCYREILIVDEEDNVIYRVKTFEEFFTFYIKQTVKDAYNLGQYNLRKAIKDIFGLTL